MSDVKTHSLNLRDSLRVVSGLAGSLRLLRRIKPDVVLAKGGYVGLPVGLAAVILRIPLVIHESDVHPGLTNRVLARYAAAVAVGWPQEHYSKWQVRRMVVTGSPIRNELFKQSVPKARQTLKLNRHKPVVTVVGGSSGAQRLNTGVFQQLLDLVKRYQLVHITGPLDIAQAQMLKRALPHEYRDNYHPYDFLKRDIGAAIVAADVVVSRAGATALAELAVASKPSIIVPNPLLTGGHQTLNANFIKKSRAAVILSEAQVSSPMLVRTLHEIITSAKLRAQLQAGIKRLAQPHATQNLAKLLLEVGDGSKKG